VLFERKMPAVVPAAAARDDVFRDVLDDEIFAADAEGRERKPLVTDPVLQGTATPPTHTRQEGHVSQS